jgi:hypothetical protein
MTLDKSEVLRVIAQREGQSSYDMVCLIPNSVQFIINNAIIAMPIPQQSISTGAYSKLVNLRRLTRKVMIAGEIWDGADDGSATGVTLNDTTGAVTGGTSVTSVLKKKWILEEMALQGAANVAFQYRGIIVPTAASQTVPPTIPSDETKNVWHKLCVITDLSVEDTVKIGVSPQSSFDRYYPQAMNVKLTLIWGSLEG